MVECLQSLPTGFPQPGPRLFHHEEPRRMQREIDRLQTFKNWHLDFITGEELANAGFYSLNKADLVECAFCGVQLAKFERGDVAVEEHKKWSPNCRFVNGLPCRNIEQDRTGREHDRPDLADYKQRFSTYQDWPPGMKQTPEIMSEAGFYYTGKSDKVICFSCGEGIYAWEETDVPIEEHAKNSPDCKYLVKKMGKDFIASVNKASTDSDAKAQELTNVILSESQGNINGAGLCKVCYDKPRSVTLMPCQHFVVCSECCLNLDACPICRKPFDSVIKTILP